jgi:serine/threonine protein kinase
VDSSVGAVDRIRHLALLGEGRHGKVFLGVDEVLQRQVVVKRVVSGSFASSETRQRLIDEARVLSRLDHPNVLRIYEYNERDAHDVFAIEFAQGKALPEALAAGLDFAKKVDVAIAIASALASAHRHDIVHGALSPRSVVITQQGEVKIVDFPSMSTDVEGLRGDVRWCSPEEAAGCEPARESDMFRFGLLLQEMFGTGDRDVRSLVTSLLRKAPSDRTTAAAALTRLQRLARRRTRRIRTAAAALLIATFTIGGAKYTIDLRRARAEAIAAQADAEKRRAQANELIGFLVEDLPPKLLSVGRLEILDATSNKAFEYFASIRPDEISAAEAAVNVRAIAQFSDAQLLKNDVPAAESAAQKAITLANGVLRKHPNDVEVLFARATAHARYAAALTRKGDIPRAFQHANAFASGCADAIRRDPDDPRFLRSQTNALTMLGNLHDRTGNMEASIRNLDLAADTLRRLMSKEAAGDAKMQLSIIERFAGTALIKLGRYADARRRLERARAEIEAELRRESNKELLDSLAGYNEQLAYAALATGDLAGASRYSADLLATSQPLAVFDTARFRWTRLVISAHRSAGTAARMSGDLDQALRHHTAAIDTAGALLARGTQQITLPRDNAHSRIEMARTLLAVGRLQRAASETKLAVDVLRTMQDDLAARMLFAEALLVRGEALDAEGDRDAAAASWEEALRVVDSLPSHPPDPRAVDTRARALLHLGRTDRATAFIEQLDALGYRNREFEALRKEKGVITNETAERGSHGRERSGETRPAG